tara:strand:- start:127 stop:288 length:162 start_codon:yes stop_codon:yes gene_type:complete
MLKFWKKKRSTEIRIEKIRNSKKSTESVFDSFSQVLALFLAFYKNTHTEAIDS